MKEMHRRYILHDGTILSIQASAGHYCAPRNNIGPYTAAEVHVVLGIGPDDWVHTKMGKRVPTMAMFPLISLKSSLQIEVD